jgi:hypothetical protein
VKKVAASLIRKSSVVLLLLAGVFAFPSCSNQGTVDASQPLEQSFQQSPPEITKAIQTVNSSLKSKDYLQAARSLAFVLDKVKLTPAQNQAVGTALKQINDAIAADPSLNSAEMYQLRQKMFVAVYNGPHS